MPLSLSNSVSDKGCVFMPESSELSPDRLQLVSVAKVAGFRRKNDEY